MIPYQRALVMWATLTIWVFDVRFGTTEQAEWNDCMQKLAWTMLFYGLLYTNENTQSFTLLHTTFYFVLSTGMIV